MFSKAFPSSTDPFSIVHIVRALASFERSLISADSPYDRFRSGDTQALTEQEIKGMELFFSDQLSCSRCHGDFNYIDDNGEQDAGGADTVFHNNGMFHAAAELHLSPNQGLFEHTQDAEDLGRFKAPTLRNIEVTAPYLHDGSVATLEELVELYADGGRVPAGEDAPLAGRTHQNKSRLIKGFPLSVREKRALLAFLRSLTDPIFLSDPSLSDPF